MWCQLYSCSKVVYDKIITLGFVVINVTVSVNRCLVRAQALSVLRNERWKGSA
jgi:hypothetical protein